MYSMNTEYVPGAPRLRRPMIQPGRTLLVRWTEYGYEAPFVGICNARHRAVGGVANGSWDPDRRDADYRLTNQICLLYASHNKLSTRQDSCNILFKKPDLNCMN